MNQQTEGADERNEKKKERERARTRTSRLVRLSAVVLRHLKEKAQKRESADLTLRRLLGLPDKKGKAQTLELYYVIPNGGDPKISRDLAEARGEAILLAAGKGLKRAERIITVQELP